MDFDLSKYGITVKTVQRNPSLPRIYQFAMGKRGNAVSSTGALISFSGAKTGRSPKDKRIVKHPDSEKNVWWGSVNIPFEAASFEMNKELAIGFFNSREDLFVIDGYAGWDPKHRIKVRIICSRPYHALFMWNMLIRPTAEELKTFGEPDWVVYNAGCLSAMKHVPGVESKTSIALSIEKREFIILGSEYAGEMKKGIFTVLNYILPLKGEMSMHCSANEGKDGDVALFFGLSGTGKTTLSADPNRFLIGDDEHGWTDDGVFNFEGGCYAKTIGLARDKEPEIYDAIRYGSVLENVGYDRETGTVDYEDKSLTENTRCSYPIDFIPNAKIPCVGGHPKNVIFLTCDAFGVLPPVSRLDGDQAMYHFISGYTAKVAGTEQGVTEPEATFSACFGAAFLMWHPTVYASLLKKKLEKYGAKVWLVNTGWTGGGYGVGKRIDLKSTRAIITAILEGKLDNATSMKESVFGFDVITAVPGVAPAILNPENAWADRGSFTATRRKLAELFTKNFDKYKAEADAGLLGAAPKL